MADRSETANKRVEFGLLGPLLVLRAGQSADLGGLQQRAVLALLLIHANALVTVDRLVDEVWEGRPPDGAQMTVRTYVHHLRQALEPDRHRGAPGEILVTRDHGYVLATQPVEIDAERFRNHVALGRAALLSGLYETAAFELRSALALWRGPVLADLADYSFVRTEAARLDEMRLGAVEDWVEAELALGHHVEMSAELNALVADNPLRERLQAQRMLALYRSGRQAEALSAYRQVRQMLADELGIDTSEPLVRLHQQMLAHDPALVWKPAVQPKATAETGPEVIASDARRWRIPTPRRRAWLALAIVVASLIAIAAVVPSFRAQNRVVAADSVGVLNHGGRGVRDVVSVGHSPDGVAFGAGAVWVTNTTDGTVTRIDPRGKRVVRVIPVGTGPSSLTVDGANVWVVNSTAGTVSRINAESNTVVQTILVGTQPVAIASGPSGIWVANNGDGTVHQIDRTSGDVLRRVPVTAGPDGIAVGKDSVWVANGRDGTVSRINPATGVVVVEIPVGSGPSGIAVTSDAVWVANSFDLSVSRIDPSTNTVVAVVHVGDGPRAIAASDNGVWVADEYDATVVRIDPQTNRVDRRLAVGGSPRSLAIAGRSVWMSGRAFVAASHRGGTLTIATDPGGFSVIDPAVTYEGDVLPVETFVYDRLVALRPSGGATGLTLVPDLATSLPRPTEGGTTYTFTLRRGIRYSTGQPVRPADIRRGVERLFTSGGDKPLENYTRIVGSEACLPPVVAVLGSAAEPPLHCDLSGGVLVDDAAWTVTFRLKQPDPDFLYKLTMYVVPTPAGFTARDSETQLLPATGPYMIAPRIQGQPIRLVRNPYFRQWSFAAQPQGYPDEIRWLELDPADQRVAVLSGKADLVGLADMPSKVVSDLSVRFPTRVYSHPAHAMEYEFLNTNIAPFNNPLARQAVNYAIDRSKVVDLAGGTAHASPACQMVPPNFPGYEPYCPYTANPSPDGAWHGPDFAKAQSLVAASGTYGAPVEVWGRPGDEWHAKSEYVVETLKSLGYKATLHETRNGVEWGEALRNPASRIQVGHGYWAADYPAASNFFVITSCGSPGEGGNYARYCNPVADAVVRQAVAVQSEQPANAGHMFAVADRMITDDSPVIPMINLRNLVFVSSRVGNYQHNPQLGPVLDQLWVR